MVALDKGIFFGVKIGNRFSVYLHPHYLYRIHLPITVVLTLTRFIKHCHHRADHLSRQIEDGGRRATRTEPREFSLVSHSLVFGGCSVDFGYKHPQTSLIKLSNNTIQG